MPLRKPSIAIVGSGNVATHLARALALCGAEIACVASHTPAHAHALADELGCKAVDSVADVPASEVDFVLISTTDRAVADVAAALPDTPAVVAHTSGSVPLSVLSGKFANSAVLYPLQTFSRAVPVDVSAVPFFTEASNARTLDDIDALARSISAHVYHADSARRRVLHIAGVLACNFPTYLWKLTAETLATEGLTLDVVRPLVEATVAKVFDVGPIDAMTGPARRGDTKVVEAHLNQLAGTNAEDVYRLLSQAIIKDFNPDCK